MVCDSRRVFIAQNIVFHPPTPCNTSSLRRNFKIVFKYISSILSKLEDNPIIFNDTKAGILEFWMGQGVTLSGKHLVGDDGADGGEGGDWVDF